MARLYMQGIHELEEMLFKIEKNAGPLAEAMIMQGSEIMKQQRIQTAKMYGHVASHEMIDHIGYAKKPQNLGSVVSNDIYSKGTDKETGVRNAEKEYLLHYGWSNYDGDHWIDEADELGGEAAYDKMDAMMNQYIQTGEVPKVTITKTNGG